MHVGRRRLSAVADDDDVPVTLEHHAHVSGPSFHGTRAVLSPGDELVPGRSSNSASGAATGSARGSRCMLPR